MGCKQSTEKGEKEKGNGNGKEEQKENQKRQLVKVLLVHRHGARNPTESDLIPFDTKENRSVENSPFTEWKKEELELLTPTGYRQLETLGTWFAKEYFKKKHPGFIDGTTFQWRSSKVDRVLFSGQQFWKGFSKELGIEPPKEPVPFSENEDADVYFRTWNDQGYREKKKKIQEGEEFEEKGKKELDFLLDICKKAGIETKDLKAGKLLTYSTSLKLMFDVEMYSEGKNALTNRISYEFIRTIDGLSQWVWTRYFFTDEFGPFLGGKLLREIILELADEKNKFAVYSAHDYNVLALLAALGQRQYPDGNCVGFGTCLLFEVYQNEKGEKWVEIILNDPFEDKEFKPTKDVQYNPINNWKWDFYHENGCQLSELTKRFAN